MPIMRVPITDSGIILQCWIMVSGVRLSALKQARITPPEPIATNMLLDTGADHTILDPAVVVALGLKPTGSMQLLSVNDHGKPTTHPTYDVGITIAGPSSARTLVTQSAVSVSAAPMRHMGIDGLLGRDMVRHFNFNYQPDINEVLIYY